MQKFDIVDIEKEIDECDWFRFGNKESECPGLTEENIKYYLKNNKLPIICDKCYKALIFWNYSEENTSNFLRMINSFNFEYNGKFNQNVVVFYFKDKMKMIDFLNYMEPTLKEYNVKGKLQWRRACREFQDIHPELWKNAKEFK